LKIIKNRQPHGPYLFGGPSFGGNVAYEMACMLMAEGETVALLALFDAFGPNYPRPAPLLARARQRLSRIAQRARRSVPSGARAESRSLPSGARAEIRPHGQAEALHPIRTNAEVYALSRIPAGQSEALKILQRVSLAHQYALQTYRASHYFGRLHLFRAESPPDWKGLLFDSPTNGWEAVVHGGIHVTTVPGTHQFILDPPWVDPLIAGLAVLVREALDPPAREPFSTSPSSVNRGQ
jgi:thioesterase domain-containing protein